MEAIALRLEAISTRLEDIALRSEAIAYKPELHGDCMKLIVNQSPDAAKSLQTGRKKRKHLDLRKAPLVFGLLRELRKDSRRSECFLPRQIASHPWKARASSDSTQSNEAKRFGAFLDP